MYVYVMCKFVHLLSVGSGVVDKGPRLEEPGPKPDTLSQNLDLSATSAATVAFTPADCPALPWGMPLRAGSSRSGLLLHKYGNLSKQ